MSNTPQQIINLGTAPNSGTGEPLREAFDAVNKNFANVWAAGPVNTSVVISNNWVTTTDPGLDLVLAGNGLGRIQFQTSALTQSLSPLSDSVYDIGNSNSYYDTSYVRYYQGSSLSVTGNVVANYFIGNGSQLTGIYGNANVAAYLPTYTGNIGQISFAGANTYSTISGNQSYIKLAGNDDTRFASDVGNVSIWVEGNIWKFDNTGNLTLPSNSAAINYANGAPYGGSGGANIGNLTVSNVTISTALPDQPVIIAPTQTYQPWWYVLYGDIGTDVNEDYGEGVAYDSAGNIFVVGGDASNGIISFLAKWDNTGNLQWQKTFALGSDYKSGESVATDLVGNVFASINDYNTGYCYVVKLDTNGNLLWQRELQTNYPELGNMATDSSGNLYFVIDNSSNRVLLKFDPLGNLLWQQETLGTAGYGVAVDASGNVTVGDDIITRYTSAGSVIWQVFVTGYSGNNIDCDAAGNVFIGITDSPNSVVQKLDSTGASIWRSTISIISGTSPQIIGVAFDVNTNAVLVTGYYLKTPSDLDIFIASLDAATGALNWINGFGGVSYDLQWYFSGKDLVSVQGPTLAVTGYTYSPTLSYGNAFVIQVPTSGEGQGIYGDFEYYTISATATVTTGSTTPDASVNQPSSIVVAAGSLTVSNNSYTSDLVEMSPGGARAWQFSSAGTNGFLEFPDGSQQFTALSSGMNWTFGNIVVNRVDTTGPNIAIGQSSGAISQSDNAIAIGYNAGHDTQGYNAIAIGQSAGSTNQVYGAIALGRYAGLSAQGQIGIAIGFSAASTTQGQQAVAIGYLAGGITQGQLAVAIGSSAGAVSQGQYSTAIGYQSGFDTQGISAVAIGQSAGSFSQGNVSIAIGYYAGYNTQGQNATAIGYSAGYSTQGSYATAIGYNAGSSNQAAGATAIGYNAGQTSQSTSAVAIGYQSGFNTQGDSAIAIGRQAGQTTQGQYSTAIGYYAGYNTQGINSIAIGFETAYNTQGNAAVAIGSGAGRDSQGNYATAVGAGAGNATQGSYATAIGVGAGNATQGNAAVAIGSYAGLTNQANNSIVINATGSALDNTTANTMVMKPVRAVSGGVAPSGFSPAYYNPTTGELIVVTS